MQVVRRLYCTHQNDIGKFTAESPDYKSTREMIDSHAKYLSQKLSGDDQERLRELDDLHENLNGVNEFESFYCGFREGTKLMIEVLKEDGDFIRKEYRLEV